MEYIVLYCTSSALFRSGFHVSIQLRKFSPGGSGFHVSIQLRKFSPGGKGGD